MTTKIDIINGAYSRGKISGLTNQPTNEDIVLGLEVLEDMAEEWKDKNIDVGYNFEGTPSTNSVHNIPRKYWTAFKTCLMMRLLADFGKEPSSALAGMARTAFSRMASSTATIPRTNYPAGHPRGSGNRWSCDNFYTSTETAPTSPLTIKMNCGEIDNFYEDYTAYLDASETIASFVLTSDSELTTDGGVLTSPRIDYEVEAGTSSGIYQVKIVATTSAGRVETRLINFVLTELDID